MKTRQKIEETANNLYGQVVQGVAKFAEGKADMVKTIMEDDLDTAYDKVNILSRSLQAIMRGAISDGVTLPGFLVKINTRSEGKLSSFNLSVTSKLKAERKFKVQRDIDVNENLIDSMAKVFTDALFPAYWVEAAAQNISELNAVLEDIYETHEIHKKVYFAVELSRKRVMNITDDTVTLNAEVDRACAISELGIMASGNEYSDLIHDEAVKAFVNVMATVSITPEILKKHINIVEQVCDIKTKKRADKIIRESYHRQAIYLKSQKDGVGYFRDTVDGVNVFSLLQLNESGEYEYVLSPFDTEKLVAVDVDVIGMLKTA